MSIFGWSYPPGAASDPSAPYNQVDPPCAICGEFIESCICIECPECGAQGDPDCYDPTKPELFHGLVRDPAQHFALAWNEAHWEEQARQESAARYHPPEEEA